MKLFTWNVRGINDLLKQKEVFNRIMVLDVDVVCVMETRVKQAKFDSIVTKWFQVGSG